MLYKIYDEILEWEAERARENVGKKKNENSMFKPGYWIEEKLSR